MEIRTFNPMESGLATVQSPERLKQSMFSKAMTAALTHISQELQGKTTYTFGGREIMFKSPADCVKGLGQVVGGAITMDYKPNVPHSY